MAKPMFAAVLTALTMGILGVSTASASTSSLSPKGQQQPPTPATNYVVVPEPDTEEPLQLENVPLGIRYTAFQAARQYVTSPTFEKAQFDTGGDLATYELAGTSSDGKTFEVDVYPDNTVEEVELVISAGDVPSIVIDALEAYFPDYTATEIERSYRPLKNGTVAIYYEFNLQTADNTDFDVDVRADGKQLVIERGEA